MNAVLKSLDMPCPATPSLRRVLLVEDNAFFVELLRMMLSSQFEVLVARDPAAGDTGRCTSGPHAGAGHLGARRSSGRRGQPGAGRQWPHGQALQPPAPAALAGGPLGLSTGLQGPNTTPSVEHR